MWKEKMRKKPKLNIVGRDDDPASSPPPPFGKAGMKLWDAIMSENKLSETRDLETLAQICAARRYAEQCAAQIARDGPVIKTKNGPGGSPAPPCVSAERSSVRSLYRLKGELTGRVGRPTPGFGVSYKYFKGSS